MKFNGDRRYDRWRAKQLARAEWHSWFAWRPVRVRHADYRWLETIKRRRVSGIFNYWQYDTR